MKWDTPDGHSPIASFFNYLHPISEEAFSAIDNGTYTVNIKKGKFILKPGSKDSNYYLIVKGVVRAYIKEDGKEITTWINEENEMIASIRNLGLDIPSEEYLQAIEDTTLIAMPLALTETLYSNFPEANIIGRLILQDNIRGAEERAYISRIPSAEKKYKRLIETSPQLINRISLKYIASYLGMTLETLSRVRGRIHQP